jgi:NSS family neurotransmitter:Na+ symporter
MSENRETWTSRVGFILAAVGSAVGLGNIWQFPFQTGTNGGAAFLVVYLAAVFLIGFPTILVEFVIGRRAERNPIDAFERLGRRGWKVAGLLGAATALWILSFYSVVGGWVVRYVYASATAAYFGDPAAYFGSIAAGTPTLALHALFMLLTVGVVASGVAGGIERTTKLMVPAIVVILVALAVWVSTLPGAAEGYAFYLTPDFGTVAANIGSILPYAVGQAFFTLSLGMGAMITYSSYLGEDDSLPADGATIVVLNTLVGVLAGFVVFPLLFSTDIDVGGGGLGYTFQTFAGAFAQLPAGQVLGTVFFVVLLLAALSSSVSLLEVIASYVVDTTDYGRPTIAVVLGLIVFLLGAPTAFGLGTLVWYNDVAYNLLLPLSVLLLLIFVGWVDAPDSMAELRKGTGLGDTFVAVWVWFVRVVAPLAVLVTLLLGLQSLALKLGLLSSAIV